MKLNESVAPKLSINGGLPGMSNLVPRALAARLAHSSSAVIRIIDIADEISRVLFPRTASKAHVPMGRSRSQNTTQADRSTSLARRV
jgi:hypothetical protein